MFPRRSNATRTDATRHAVIATARALFTDRGYAATTLSEIAAAAGYSTGALYHHWGGKKALLGSVVEQVYAEFGAALTRSTPAAAPPRQRLKRAGEEFLRLCTRGDTARLLLVDAPAALGYARWREIDDGWWLAPTMRLIAQCDPQHHPRRLPQPVESEALRSRALCVLGSLSYLGREVALNPDADLERACAAHRAVVEAVTRPAPA